MQITDEMRDRAARAIYALDCPPEVWDEEEETDRKVWRQAADAALEAALNHAGDESVKD